MELEDGWDTAYQTASEAADRARALTGHVQGDPALAAYGSLCLVSALAAAVTGRNAEAAERIAEAEAVAARVGECSPTVATFGPTNVAMYQMKGALEVEDCELAARLGGQIEPQRIISAERRGDVLDRLWSCTGLTTWPSARGGGGLPEW